MEEVVADLLFAQAVRWRVVVDCELPYDAKVGPLSALAKTGELKVLMHLLAECGGHDSFLVQRVKNQPLRGNMRHGPSGCQGVPDRPEFREAATTLRAQCETLDQPAALAAYLNQRSRTQNPKQMRPQPALLKEVGASKPTAAHASGGPVAGGAIGTSGIPLTASGRERPPDSDACKQAPKSWVL